MFRTPYNWTTIERLFDDDTGGLDFVTRTLNDNVQTIVDARGLDFVVDVISLGDFGRKYGDHRYA